MVNELMRCMQDTLDKSFEEKLRKKTELAIQSNRVYKEGFTSNVQYCNEVATVEICVGSTFEIAKNYLMLGKIAVLNFANPEYSGGGVWNGAMAQEECLCRSSNLYACISNENVFDEYYNYHRGLKNCFYSDRLIYTKNVTVFKSEYTPFSWQDDVTPQLMPENEWFDVDVITCAAPYIAQRTYTNSAALLALFKRRIRNIFEAARDNQVGVIVLGAWGCGAFKNPPKIVARAFHEVINENNYTCCFKKIVFAIKSTATYDRFTWGSSYCPNIAAFEEEFYGSHIKQNEINIVNSEEIDKKYKITVDEDLLIGDIVELKVTHQIVEIKKKDYQFREQAWIEYAGKDIHSSKESLVIFYQKGVERIIKKVNSKKRRKYFSKIENILKKKEHKTWVESNPYYGKQFSIFGDSISTLDGYNPRGYSVFYSGENSEKSGVVNMQDTWWDKVINYFGGELLINNSWSGSRVTKLQNREELFPSGCSNERTSSLHINEVKPDVIIVYLGTNDWGFGVKTNVGTGFLREKDEELFDISYERMLKKLKRNYPNCEIWCCTLCATYISSHPQFIFPYSHGGLHIEVYNDIIREVAQKNSCKLIDLYSYRIPYDSIDGIHPTKEGMSILASLVVRSIIREQDTFIMDCPNNMHDYFIAEEYTGGTKYVCKNCFKVKHDNTLFYGSTIDDNLIGTKVCDRYTVLKRLKWDGIFKCYFAMEEQTNKVCVIKKFDKQNQKYAEVIQETILKKYYEVMKFDHPAIPKVFDIIEDNNSIYIIIEYVEGETLDVVLRNNGLIAENDVITWAKQLCEVLGYMHKLKPSYVYRDIKPANIVLQPCGNIKLIDFDTIQVYDVLKDRDEYVIFTKGYASPEAYQGRTDPRSDIFSLGITLHQLVTGVDPCEPPYEVKPIRTINPNLSSELEAIIQRCTNIAPGERFQTCDELLVALQGGMVYPPQKKKLLDILFRKKSFKSMGNTIEKKDL